MLIYVRSALKTSVVLLAFPALLQAQMTMIYDNDLLPYNRGLELYEKQKYGAAKEQFERAVLIIDDQDSELSANAHFYIAECAMELFHKDAEFLLKEFIRNYSTSPRVKDAWFLLGNYNYRKKSWEEAIEYYDELQLADMEEPRRSEYLFKKGYSCFQSGQPGKAADQFYQLKDDQSIYFAPGTYYLAHINYEQEKYATALKGFQSLSDHPLFSEVVPYYIVQIYHFQKDYEQVITYGTPFLASEDVKRKAEISRLVGEALYNKGEFAEAAPFLEEFMQSNLPKDKDDYYVLGYTYYKSGNYDKAAEQLSKISYNEDLVGQNALYHLGEAYLRADKKSYARNAYRSASKMHFDEHIREDALFKYAQLSYELSYDPYEGAIAAFKEYIQEFPGTERTQEAFDYLVNIYLTSRNYDAALSSIEEYQNPDIRLREAYQRIAFNKGVSLYQERQYRNAITYFDKALKYTQSKTITSEAQYWKAESLYYLGDYTEAAKAYETFIYSSGAVLTPYFNLANYNIGYTYFQQDKFNEALTWFRRFTSFKKEEDEVKLADANLRIGDAYFMMSRYDDAEIYYAEAVKSGKSDPDYALYQSAMTAGLKHRLDDKLTALTALVQKYPRSRYLDAAYYEIGRTYIARGEGDKALENLNKVVKDFPGSSYVRRALVSIGQTHYNAERNDQALETFMQIIKAYPTYEDSREALIGIQNIYTERGEINRYEELISTLDFVNISELALDSLNYEAAENQYFNGQCAEAVTSFTKYLNRFSKGIFQLNARFYRAECLYKMGQEAEAMKDYDFVAEQPKNKFSESSLLKLARYHYKKGDCPAALAHYKRLALLGEYRENLLESEIGQMRCNYALNNYQGAIANAIITLESDKVDENIRNEANLIVGKSNLQLENIAEAGLYLDKVIDKGSPSQAAEAMYLRARILFNQDMLDSAEAGVFKLVERYQEQPFWIGKALILLSDIYVTRGDIFQATATLQSIIENYKEDDEVKRQATEKLDTIRQMQSRKDEEGEEEIEINLNAADSLLRNDEPRDSQKNE